MGHQVVMGQEAFLTALPELTILGTTENAEKCKFRDIPESRWHIILSKECWVRGLFISIATANYMIQEALTFS